MLSQIPLPLYKQKRELSELDLQIERINSRRNFVFQLQPLLKDSSFFLSKENFSYQRQSFSPLESGIHLLRNLLSNSLLTLFLERISNLICKEIRIPTEENHKQLPRTWSSMSLSQRKEQRQLEMIEERKRGKEKNPNSKKISSFSIKNLSFLAKETEKRCSYLLKISRKNLKDEKRRRHSSTFSMQERKMRQINSKNEFLLLCLNLVFGILLGVFIWRNLDYFVWKGISLYHFLNNKILKDSIIWIYSGVPAGFKLNAELDNSLSALFLFYLKLWETLTHNLLWFKIIFKLCACLGSLGISFQLSLLSDSLSLLTLHIDLGYSFMHVIFRLVSNIIFALALLFSGKKRNILRSRVDSLPNSDIDQLVLGTILFLLSLLLLPTIFFHFFLFALLFHFKKILLRSLSFLVLCCNQFPLFLAFSFFTSHKMNGGISFQVLESKKIPLQEKREQEILFFELKANFSFIFVQNFLDIFTKESKHFSKVLALSIHG